MYRAARSDPKPNEILSVIKHYAPSTARFYRLRDLHSGALLPGEGRAALLCDVSSRVDHPADASVGSYQILYYRGAFDLGSAVAPAEGQQAPTIVVGDDGVLMTPADWWRAEEAKHQHLERRDLSIRRETALTRTIEGLAASLVESNAAITANQVAINKLQVEMFGLMRELMAQSKSSMDAQGDALVNTSRKIAEAVNNIKTDNVATVGVELVKQVGAIAQTYAANSGNRENALRDGKPRILDPKPAVAKLPAAKQQTRSTRPEDPPPPPPAPVASPAAQRRDLPADLVIQWDDLFTRDETPSLQAPVARAVPDGDPIERATESTAGTDEEPAQETGLVPLAPGMPDFSALFALFGLRAPVVRPPASEWSPAWAVRKIKERIASLSEVSISWLLSSWQNALSYLRELADIARPPDPALLAEQGSQ